MDGALLLRIGYLLLVNSYSLRRRIRCGEKLYNEIKDVATPMSWYQAQPASLVGFVDKEKIKNDC